MDKGELKKKRKGRKDLKRGVAMRSLGGTAKPGLMIGRGGKVEVKVASA